MRRKVWKVETSGTPKDVADYAMPNGTTSGIKLRLSLLGGGYEPWIGWNVTQPAAMSLNVVINSGSFVTVQNQTLQNPSYSITRWLSKGEVHWLGGTTSIVAILRGTESYFTTPNDCFGWYNQDTWLSKK